MKAFLGGGRAGPLWPRSHPHPTGPEAMGPTVAPAAFCPPATPPAATGLVWHPCAPASAWGSWAFGLKQRTIKGKSPSFRLPLGWGVTSGQPSLA